MLLACVVLAIGALPYSQHRWVEDESWYSIPAVTLLRTGELRNPALPAYDTESRVVTWPPLMPLSLAASFHFLGTSVAAARSGVLLAVLLALFVVYAIGRQLGNPLAGGIAAVLLAADNFVVLASRTARPDAWVMLFGSCALLCLLRRPSWQHAFMAGLCAATSSLFHVLGVGWLAATAAVLLFQERSGILRSRRTYAYGAGVSIAVLPFVLWLLASSERIEAARHMYGRGVHTTVSGVIAKETLRFSDYLGVPNDRLHVPLRIPLRLHIALAIASAFVILWRRNRDVFWILFLATLPHLIWLVRLYNPTARYLAIEAPLFALAIGFGATALSETRWHRGALAACALCVVTQLAGTALLLNQASKADYPALTEKLRAAIPPGHSCYAAMTFQLALADRECHSYDRTPFLYTANVQRPEYLILGDRVMMSGSGIGQDTFAATRREAFAFVGRHGQLTARIYDPFYGDLRIYRVAYDSPAHSAVVIP
jgi:4-amino-4-deoxy-L-arabinose transferase-like glycosyltransferase